MIAIIFAVALYMSLLLLCRFIEANIECQALTPGDAWLAFLVAVAWGIFYYNTH